VALMTANFEANKLKKKEEDEKAEADKIKPKVDKVIATNKKANFDSLHIE
jgi:hypothetical protein